MVDRRFSAPLHGILDIGHGRLIITVAVQIIVAADPDDKKCVHRQGRPVDGDEYGYLFDQARRYEAGGLGTGQGPIVQNRILVLRVDQIFDPDRAVGQAALVV